MQFLQILRRSVISGSLRVGKVKKSGCPLINDKRCRWAFAAMHAQFFSLKTVELLETAQDTATFF